MPATPKPSNLRTWAESGQKTDPGASKYANGWVVEIPTLQNMNYIQNQITQYIKHNNEQGISAWDASTIYPIWGLAKGPDGIVYKALAENDNDLPPSANWTIFGASDGDFTRRGNTVIAATIGIGGDYPSITAALEDLSIIHPEYAIPNVRATLTLLIGYVIAEAIHILSVDLSWITITSEQGITPHTIQSSALITPFDQFGSTCVLGVRGGGSSPYVDFVGKFDIPNSGVDKYGIILYEGSNITGNNVGMIQAGNSGISCHLSSNASFEGTADFSKAQRYGILCASGATIGIRGNLNCDQAQINGIECAGGGVVACESDISAKECVDSGIKALEAGHISATNINCSASASIGVNSSSGGTVVAFDTVTAGACVIGIAAYGGTVQSLHVVCNNASEDGIRTEAIGAEVLVAFDISVQNCGSNGIYLHIAGFVTAGTTINANGAGIDGIQALGGRVECGDQLACQGAGNRGIWAYDGGQVNAKNIDASQAVQHGIWCEGAGSAVSARENITTASCGEFGVVSASSGPVSAGKDIIARYCNQAGVVSAGGDISAENIDARRQDGLTATDLVGKFGGMIRISTSVTGNHNLTPGTFNADGYINM